MIKGFDCAAPLTSTTAAAFARDGYRFVCRYLVPASWKALTRAEAETISAAGLRIVSVFETKADRALGGYASGTADGKTALSVAKAVGQPEGSAIYFAVDFDASASQMPKVIDYIRGCAEAAQGYAAGVYGSASVVEAVQAAGVCNRYWQTLAWSRGRVVDGIHIYQYDNGPDGLGLSVNGIKVDLDYGYGDYGGWRIGEEDEGDDSMAMKLDTWQWKMLGDALDGLYRKTTSGELPAGQGITDYRWAEKAYKGELTADELAWLVAILVARQNGVEV